MSASICIRKASSSDVPALLVIEERCFSSDRICSRQMHYLLTQAKATTRIAVDGAMAVGYGLCLLPALPRPARLYSLAVLPHWRGQSLARRLAEGLLAELESLNYSRCRLEVRGSQTNVRSFYQSLGFNPIAELPGYYQDGEDGLRMECILNNSQSPANPGSRHVIPA